MRWKSLLEGISVRYRRTDAKKLIADRFPKLKYIIDFENKWNKSIKQTDKVNSLVIDARNHDALPADLMTHRVLHSLKNGLKQGQE